jgi:hypothetical protein
MVAVYMKMEVGGEGPFMRRRVVAVGSVWWRTQLKHEDRPGGWAIGQSASFWRGVIVGSIMSGWRGESAAIAHYDRYDPCIRRMGECAACRDTH